MNANANINESKKKGRPVYLDYQATTPMDPRVVEAMAPFFGDKFGNPHSRNHFYGWEAEEAVEKANNTPYGLSAGIWTEKGSLIHWMAAQLRAGVVWANTFNKFDPASPFGGYKRSGKGRESGQESIKEFLQVKSVWIAQETTTANPFIMRL